jgi:hypothetical protein
MNVGFKITLSPSEVQEVTRRRHRVKQARQLAQAGIPFIEGPDGWPIVLRSAIEGRLGGAKPNRRPSEPDADALRAMQNGQKKKTQ